MRSKLFILGTFIILGLLFSFWTTFPDGKLHVVFCDVGQGDGIYIKAPNGVDILVDAGPNNKVLDCLNQEMPFYDRVLEVLILTHPQKDHLGGFVEVIKRYKVEHFITIPVSHKLEAYEEIVRLIEAKEIPTTYLTKGEALIIGEVNLTALWPSKNWLKEVFDHDSGLISLIENDTREPNLKGLSTDLDLNAFSLYIHLNYNKFDLLLTGDGDQGAQELFQKYEISLPSNIEVLKVPHHGSKTGILDSILSQLSPELSVIQVSKTNSYGHPNKDLIANLDHYGEVRRNDLDGKVELVSDGVKWELLK